MVTLTTLSAPSRGWLPPAPLGGTYTFEPGTLACACRTPRTVPVRSLLRACSGARMHPESWRPGGTALAPPRSISTHCDCAHLCRICPFGLGAPLTSRPLGPRRSPTTRSVAGTWTPTQATCTTSTTLRARRPVPSALPPCALAPCPALAAHATQSASRPQRRAQVVVASMRGRVYNCIRA